MKVFEKQESCNLLRKMKQFSAFLQREKTFLKKQCIRDTKGIRYIMGKRVEIIMRERAFDNLLVKCFGDNEDSHFSAKDVEKYIKNEVGDDPLYNEEMEFANFSFIVSYGHVPMQSPHIDTTGRNFQFVISLGYDQPPTIGYDLEGDFPSLGHVLVGIHDLWDREFKTCPELLHRLKTDRYVEETISLYGSLLLPFDDMDLGTDNLEFGQVVGMNGGTIHASPKVCHRQVRVVLFCSALANASHGMEYNDDYQMSKPVLWYEICSRIWDGLPKEEKLVALKKLKKYVFEIASIELEGCILKPEWNHLVEQIRKLVDNPTKVQQLLKLFSADEHDEMKKQFPSTNNKKTKKRKKAQKKAVKKVRGKKG